LVLRDISVRYKQTLIGVLWALFQPLINMIILSVVFGYFLKVPSDGVPYPIFVLTSQLCWRYFATAMSQGGSSLVSNAHLVSKVYFPRLIIPLTSVISPLVDFFISFILLLLVMPFFGILPSWQFILVPFFAFFTIFTAMSVSLWLSALNVRYRDVTYIIPFFVQIWMYITPVIYPLSIVPQQWRWLYSLNPLVGVTEGVRWAILGTENFDVTSVTLSMLIVFLLFWGGLHFFNRSQKAFADVI
jgi:lipopolysaccharide transport system permease protein